MSNNRNLRISNNTADKFKNVPASNRNALVKGYNKSSFNNRRSVFGKGQPTTNNDMSNTIVVNANVRNNTNPVKQALDEKIKNEFDNKTYDLIVHFKGFNNLFDYGVYNGEEEDNKTHEIMKNHIQKIADEYMVVIKEKLNTEYIKNNTQLDDKILNNKTLLLVWDGDGLEKTQWTQVMIATANKLKEQEAKIEFLCCYQTKSGNYGQPENFTDSLNILGEVHQFTYEEIGVKDYNEVGMVLLYVTSNLINKNKNKNKNKNNNNNNNNKILVLCAGGGQIPVNEYKFTRKVSDNLTDINHPLALQLIDEMEQSKFEWKASEFINSRRNINAKDGNGVEISMLKKQLNTQVRRAHALGGARKKRTKKSKSLKKKKASKKSSKKSKSLKKKSKKNKSKSKRKC